MRSCQFLNSSGNGLGRFYHGASTMTKTRTRTLQTQSRLLPLEKTESRLSLSFSSSFQHQQQWYHEHQHEHHRHFNSLVSFQRQYSRFYNSSSSTDSTDTTDKDIEKEMKETRETQEELLEAEIMDEAIRAVLLEESSQQQQQDHQQQTPPLPIKPQMIHQDNGNTNTIANLSKQQIAALRENKRQQKIQQQQLQEQDQQQDSYYQPQLSNGINATPTNVTKIRLSKLLSSHATNLTISRGKAEKLIQNGQVTLAGEPITLPFLTFTLAELANNVVKVKGVAIQFQQEQEQSQQENENDKSKNNKKEQDNNNHKNNNKTSPEFRRRLWMVHKLSGEVVSENDPHNRPSMIKRLYRGAVGYNRQRRKREHLKPVGRLDMATEGLILVTNDGEYARQLELPRNKLHRTYRVRAHGLLAPYKLERMRKGVTINGVRYQGMKVTPEASRGGKSTSANSWCRVTCTEGKNRMIRNVFSHLGLNVTRLIRVSFGDYHLQKLPPGMAVEMPPIAIDQHKRRGTLMDKQELRKERQRERRERAEQEQDDASPIRWVKYS